MKTITKKTSLKAKDYLLLLAALFMGSWAVKAQCNANFTFSMMPNGTVIFLNTSNVATTPVGYYWNFGNGTYGTASNPTVTYTANGIYTVQLTMNDSTPCVSTIQRTLSINNIYTPGCTPSAVFSLVKDSILPLTWDIYPVFPPNTVSAVWNWGDGTSSSFFYGAHTYSAAGMYNVCLTVSLSCGAATTTCLYSNVYRSSENLNAIQVNVVNSTVGLQERSLEMSFANVCPNPTNGEFKLSFNGLKEKEIKINIYDHLGKVVYSEDRTLTNGLLDKTISLTNISDGVYYIKAMSAGQIFTGKILISK